MTAPNPTLVNVTTGETPLAGNTKVNANFLANQTYTQSLENRIASLEKSLLPSQGPVANPVTDSTAFLFSQKATPWTTDTLLSSVKITNVAQNTMSVDSYSVMARDANNVPTRIIVCGRGTNGSGGYSDYTAILGYTPGSGALALLSTKLGTMSLTSSAYRLTVAGTTATTARIFMTPLGSGGGENVYDVTCAADGTGVAVGPAVGLSGQLSSVYGANATNQAGYLVGATSIVMPLPRTGTPGRIGFGKASRAVADGNMLSADVTPAQAGSATQNAFAQDLQGTGRFVTASWGYHFGAAAGRLLVSNVFHDDATSDVLGQAFLPYACSTVYQCVAMSGSLALAQWTDGTTIRTAGFQTSTSGAIAQVANALDGTGIFGANTWRGTLTYSGNVTGVLTQASTNTTAYVLTYARFDPAAATPLAQGTAIGASYGNVAVTMGSAEAYGTTTSNTCRFLLRLDQTATTDNYLALGFAITSSTASAWAEVHQVS